MTIVGSLRWMDKGQTSLCLILDCHTEKKLDCLVFAGGWKKYEVLTNKIQAKMDKYIEDKSLNIEVVKGKTDSLQTKVKFQAFGKSKPSTEKAKNRRLEREQKAASQLDDEGSSMEEIQQQQSALIETAINEIKAGKHGRKTNVHKMREVVSGPKKQQQEAHAVKDYKTGKTVVSTKEIKRVNLEHCLEVLKNNVPKPEVVNHLKFQSDLHDIMMEDTTDEDTHVTEEEFNNIVPKFKKKNKKSYEFLTKSGKDFQSSIYKFCKRMLDEEDFPSDFSITVLYQLWKRKGSKENLNNHRYIHMKNWLPRLTESLAVSMMKEDIIQNGAKYQIGGIPGHRVEVHLIVVKSVIGLYIHNKAGIVMQLVDIEKFFDKEILRTIMTCLNSENINKKAYRCWFKLNQKTAISVATPAGQT